MRFGWSICGSFPRSLGADAEREEKTQKSEKFLGRNTIFVKY